MLPQERAEVAADYKLRGVCNCCQAVTKAFADTVSADEQTMQKMCSGFAAGMGTMEATCGSLIGACMIAGLRNKGGNTIRLAKEIHSRFKEKSGATICKELKGIGSGRVLCSCDNCVRNAVLSAEEAFAEVGI